MGRAPYIWSGSPYLNSAIVETASHRSPGVHLLCNSRLD